MMKTPSTAALIVAAGRGIRAGQGIPKQYRPMPDGGGDIILARSLAAFDAAPEISRLCVVIHKEDVSLYEKAIKKLQINKNIDLCFGGETRQASVLNGLNSLAEHAPDYVLIHDAARPYVSPALISHCVAALANHKAAIPALPVTDTLKRAKDATITETVPRDNLWRAQTPQAFHFDAIRAAHQAAPPELTDDAAVVEAAGLETVIVAGDAQNIKLTHEEDFHMTANMLVPRTGNGFDVHRFGDSGSAETIMLGGVKVAHDRAIIGHSDADVGLHAITDALLGALAAGDIGTHFPPTDAANKDRASDVFLSHAVKLADERRAKLTHIDLTLICEAPKITPHRDAMRDRIAEITGLSQAAVSVKATTTETLGFTGREEGIAAQATVTLLMPEAS